MNKLMINKQNIRATDLTVALFLVIHVCIKASVINVYREIFFYIKYKYKIMCKLNILLFIIQIIKYL